jgi:hypothetical protein
MGKLSGSSPEVDRTPRKEGRGDWRANVEAANRGKDCDVLTREKVL